MDQRPFGSSRRLVPALGLGTWKMEQEDRAAAIATIRRAVELGLAHVDTAEMYGSGKVEAIVGEALAGIRDRVFLVSKVLPSNASYEGTIRACERSLKALRTERLDCYLLHWPGSHPLEETIRAFVALEQAGKILSFGVSNFDAVELEEAIRIAGKGRITCNQVLYNLEERTIEHAVLPACEKHGVALVAYSPIGAEKFRSSKELDAIAAAHGVSPRRVALAFLLRRRSVFAIPKTSSIAHLEQLAVPLQLSDDEAARLDRAYPIGPWTGLATT